jgi:hypothetical protein
VEFGFASGRRWAARGRPALRRAGGSPPPACRARSPPRR